MARKRKDRKRKPLLSRLEQDLVVLDKHRFEDEELDATRKSLLRQYLIRPELSARQKSLVHRLASPIRNKTKRSRATRRREKHYVYAISDGHNVKIGLAVDPQKRLGDLQVASPSFLKLEAKIECSRYSYARQLEMRLHKLCRKHHIRGEWFEPEAMKIFDTCEGL